MAEGVGGGSWRRELAEGVNRPEWLHLSFGEWMSGLEAMASQEAVATRLPQLRELEGHQVASWPSR